MGALKKLRRKKKVDDYWKKLKERTESLQKEEGLTKDEAMKKVILGG